MAINVFTASGNAGSDMEVRFTPNNKAIGSFSFPVKSGWGENEKVAWVTCKVFGERAQKLANHITKGTKLTITGSFTMDEWEKDGVKHSRPVILVNDFEFSGAQQGNQQQSQGQRQQPQGYQQQARQQPQQQGNQQNNYRNNGNQNNQSQMPEPDFDFDDD